MLDIFYQSVVASALFFSVVYWKGRIERGNTNRLNKWIRKASIVIGYKLDTMEAVVKRRVLNKLLCILDKLDTLSTCYWTCRGAPLQTEEFRSKTDTGNLSDPVQ